MSDQFQKDKNYRLRRQRCRLITTKGQAMALVRAGSQYCQ
jgi:hypothetical protein